MKRTFAMRKMFFVSAVSLMSILAGCVPGNKFENSFAEPVFLPADSVRISQVIQVGDWTVAGNKAVVFSPMTDNVFYVYKLPEFDFLFSFGRKGEGPQDFSDFMRMPEGNIMNDDLYVYDNGSSRGPLFVISLSDSSYVQERVTGLRKGFSHIVSDSLWIGYSPVSINWADMSVKGSLSLWNGHGETLEELPLMTHTSQFGFTYRDMANKSGIMISGEAYNKAGVTSNGKKLAVYYPDAFRMEFYRIKADGRLELEKYTGGSYTPNELNEMDLAGRKEGESLTLLRSTDDYVYAFKYLYANDGSGRKPVKSYLEIYGWDGNGIVKYDLGRYFDKYIVDERSRRIFCYDTGTDFDYVYAYEYELP